MPPLPLQSRFARKYIARPLLVTSSFNAIDAFDLAVNVPALIVKTGFTVIVPMASKTALFAVTANPDKVKSPAEIKSTLADRAKFAPDEVNPKLPDVVDKSYSTLIPPPLAHVKVWKEDAEDWKVIVFEADAVISIDAVEA
jgi:hypothetical protein